ncbi:MAG: helix-turn-helix domain-containing protein [Anaerolineales bacterium]|nr:helix-turn-helix domain-containing protein [Anaerolineales bacterium]
MPHKKPIILTAAEVAARLRVTTRTVARLFERGEFPHSRKMGTGRNSAIAFWADDVEAYEKKLAALNKE